MAIDFETEDATGTVRVRCTVRAVERTGVEMEAMTGASVAAFRIFGVSLGALRLGPCENTLRAMSRAPREISGSSRRIASARAIESERPLCLRRGRATFSSALSTWIRLKD